MILVDSSAWIDFFRNRGPLAAVLDRLLEEGEVAVCGPIVTELRRGVVRPAQRAAVLRALSACHDLDQPQALWEAAGELGQSLARRGLVVKTIDLLIATWALSHRVPLLTRDGDFVAMRRAGVDLILYEG